jgi:hypothetical protein
MFSNAAAMDEDRLWRLTVSQYHDMIRAGIVTTNDAALVPAVRFRCTSTAGCSDRLT